MARGVAKRGAVGGVGVAGAGGMLFMRVIDCGRGRTCDGDGGRPIAPNVGIGGVGIFGGEIIASSLGGGGADDTRTMRAGVGGEICGSGGGEERGGGAERGSGGGAERGIADARAGSGGGADRCGSGGGRIGTGDVCWRRIASIVVVADVSATDADVSFAARARQSTAYAPGFHAC